MFRAGEVDFVLIHASTSRLASCKLTGSCQQVLRMDYAALELDAVKFAKTAVTYDQNGKYNEAVFYYKVSGYI